MVNMSTNIIKKRPFCGGEAVTIESYNYRANKFLPAVMCLECKSRTITFLNTEDAIKAWNTRTPVENVLEWLEKLKEYESSGDCPKDGICKSGTCNTCYTDTALQIIKDELMAAVNSNEWGV